MKQHNKGNAVLILIVLVALFFGYTAIKKSEKVSPKKEDSSVIQNENSQSNEDKNTDGEDSSSVKEDVLYEKDNVSGIKNVEKAEDIVCCKTGAVVLNPIYYYEFTKRDECKPPCEITTGSAGNTFKVCAPGESFEIVSDSLCKEGKVVIEDTRKYEQKPPVHVSSVLPLPEYVYAQGDWPPVVEHLHKKYECHEGDTGGDVPLITEERVINRKTFCISSTTDAAAGSRYTDYTYTTPVSDGVEEVNFTLRYPNCGAYDSPTRERCEYSQSHFNLDTVVASFNW